MSDLLVHKHLIVRAELEDPPYNVVDTKRWIKNLIETINMNILMGPYAVYSDMPGNQGITCVAIIETSHIALHVWDEVSPALCQLDVYSCAPFDIEDVVKAIQEFKPSKFEYKYIDREHNLTLLDKGVK